MGDLCVAFFLFSVTFLIPMLVVFIMDLDIREYPEGVLILCFLSLFVVGIDTDSSFLFIFFGVN